LFSVTCTKLLKTKEIFFRLLLAIPGWKRYNGSMIVFINSKNKNRQKIVLFQTGNYQYEIWNQTTKNTVRILWDTNNEDAVAIFNSL